MQRNRDNEEPGAGNLLARICGVAGEATPRPLISNKARLTTHEGTGKELPGSAGDPLEGAARPDGRHGGTRPSGRAAAAIPARRTDACVRTQRSSR